MPILLTKKFLLLCEGLVDKAFFRKLLSEYKCPEFDIPFPQDSLARGETVLWGKDSFDEMLRSIRGSGASYQGIKVILIAVDSRDKHQTTFDEVCAHIRRAGNLGIPANELEIAKSDPGHPSLSIILVPGQRPGSLETICVEAIAEKTPELIPCVDAYLKCGPIKASTWNAEPRDKARLQCLIAATNEEDPNKTIRWIFDKNIIPISSKTFKDIGEKLQKFCAEAAKL